MKEPVDHVLRPQLPWRSESAITECGYDATKVKTISREELLTRRREMGQQRTAILTCMTCVETATRWVTWDDDPRQALEREIQWEHRGQWSTGHDSRGKRLLFELRAIAELIGTHRAEFDELVTRLEGLEEWQTTKANRQEQRIRRPRGRQL